MSRGNNIKNLCIIKEREALLELKQGLVDDEYKLLSSWRNEENNEECFSWRGLECSNTTGCLPHILVLNLHIGTTESNTDGPDKNLILTGSHRLLEFLSFEGNALTGSLINLTTFSSLKELRLRENSLNGIFHESFRQISCLEYLDLSNNQMTGSLPDLAFFPSLRELHLQSNHFYGMIPQGLGKLSELKTLDVSFNRLQGFLDNLGKLSKMKILDVYFNRLKGLPEILGQLFDLGTFDAPNNLLECTISESHFSNLCNLRSSKFSSNSLTWNASVDWIPDYCDLMSALTVLNVANSRIYGTIPYSLCSSTSLSSPYVCNNNLSGQLPVSLKKCQGLKVLDLGRNRLSAKIPEWIGTKLAGSVMHVPGTHESSRD
ncbi:receptor-like protein EIX1 [Solanum lycopersicum]|uniref:receptor-like protein EIX1 n=1 Tax=Solanum lycopersicum TaxID=4081 RepID=UPI00374A1636